MKGIDRISATYTLPATSTARLQGHLNCSGPGPKEPREIKVGVSSPGSNLTMR
ncbi:MAG TPA: hypothetical protein PL110_19765 [Candidatus Eremiobacteraeota bacterium]|nr:hypothetical protein [Candidatus Eremiobacteraeota bacterium]